MLFFATHRHSLLPITSYCPVMLPHHHSHALGTTVHGAVGSGQDGPTAQNRSTAVWFPSKCVNYSHLPGVLIHLSFFSSNYSCCPVSHATLTPTTGACSTRCWAGGCCCHFYCSFPCGDRSFFCDRCCSCSSWFLAC